MKALCFLVLLVTLISCGDKTLELTCLLEGNRCLEESINDVDGLAETERTNCTIGGGIVSEGLACPKTNTTSGYCSFTPTDNNEGLISGKLYYYTETWNETTAEAHCEDQAVFGSNATWID